jgi:DNA-binding LacI/PurR family transcriptional regulator
MAEQNPKKATLHDVARLANVSHQTVSRVINGSPNVAVETRARVEKAIEALDYRPNRAARSLITGRSQTIQIIDFEASYIAPVPAVVSCAGDLGYRTGVSILRSRSISEFRLLLDNLTSWLVDGLVLFDPQMSLDPQELTRMCRGIPYVQLGGEPVAGIPSVVYDQAEGVGQLLEHLVSRGHRRIAEISGPLFLYDARARHETIQRCLVERGLVPGPWAEGDFSAALAYQLTRELLNKGDFSALMCANDNTALGALRALHECGLHVPADISVVGFDDNPDVQFYNPPLTTVRQDYATLSRIAIEDLIARIEDSERPGGQKMLMPQLVVRESTRQID